ncbi:hypothetical protein FZU01_20740 [Salmonella enterica subsp. enterica]|nr:hypothetical protein [Salmonella enterica subsp. enterica serovar Kintambo]ECV5098153.1 hypothetical protein [Salmonella enterica subsp. enterica serovar Kintambo]ELX7028073.1 hypothetical protein [Salmonella enterica]EMA0079647.1 hypothetical protein [Salmonella enterica]EMA5860770.1 hypothetical protein [Salmonella enterica]
MALPVFSRWQVLKGTDITLLRVTFSLCYLGAINGNHARSLNKKDTETDSVNYLSASEINAYSQTPV